MPADDYVTQFVKDVSRAKVIQAGAIMQEPNAVAHESQGPVAALHAMQSCGTDRVFLLGGDRVLKGVLTEDRAAALDRQRVTTLEETQAESVTTASPDDYIEDIIPMAARTEYPIPVVDDQRRLLGEVHRGSLLACIVEGGAGDVSADIDAETGGWQE